MSERDRISGVGVASNGSRVTKQERSVTVFPDGKILIGLDANFHPEIGVAGDRKARLKYSERPRRTY